MDPRFRGGDELPDFHSHGWVEDPWQLLNKTRRAQKSLRPRRGSKQRGRSVREPAEHEPVILSGHGPVFAALRMFFHDFWVPPA